LPLPGFLDRDFDRSVLTRRHARWLVSKIGESLLEATSALWMGLQSNPLLLLADVRTEQEKQVGGAETHAQAFEEIPLCPRQARH
jgi:hypothetical protein